VWTLEEHAKGNSAPKWLIEDILPAKEHAMLYAWTGHLKSFTGVHIAQCIASGKSINGKKVDQGEVVYIAAESPITLRERMVAWENFYNIETGIHFIDTPIQTTNEQDMMHLSRFIQSREGKVKLVIFDTISRCAVDVDENQPTSVDKGVNFPIDTLIRETGAGVLMLHHRGAGGSDKQRRPRGCTAWSGWASTVIYGEAKFNTDGIVAMVTLETEKQRSSKKTSFLLKPHFTGGTVVLGDQEGVLEKKQREINTIVKPRLSNQDKILLLLDERGNAHYTTIADELFNGNYNAAKIALSRTEGIEGFNGTWKRKKVS